MMPVHGGNNSIGKYHTNCKQTSEKKPLKYTLKQRAISYEKLSRASKPVLLSDVCCETHQMLH